MRLTQALAIVVVFSATTLSEGQDSGREIRRSPDGRYFVGWFDHDAGPPFGLIRPIVVRSASDPYDIFSLVSVPRSTDAAWNPASNRCVIADAPDNGGPKVWLVCQKPNAPDGWTVREIDPFAPIYEEFRKSDPKVRRLFRPSILKITWISDREVQFRGYCNTGTYLLTIDTSDANSRPVSKKLSDQLLEE